MKTNEVRKRCGRSRETHVSPSSFTFALLIAGLLIAAAAVPVLPPVLAGVASMIVALDSTLLGLFGRELLGLK